MRKNIAQPIKLVPINSIKSAKLLTENFNRRSWMKKHGKSNKLLFSDDMLNKLKTYFRSLDEDGSETISSNQLEDPLILFGLCKDKDQVQKLVKQIDFDGNGEIQFKEFLEVFRRVKAQKMKMKQCMIKNLSLHDIKEAKNYEQFTQTLLGMQTKLDKDFTFRMGMSIYRRKHILNALMVKNKSQQKREKSNDIMNNFKTQISDTPLALSRSRKVKTQNDCEELIQLIEDNRKSRRQRHYSSFEGNS